VHELDPPGDVPSVKFLVGEYSQPIVEQVKLNPLLVQCKILKGVRSDVHDMIRTEQQIVALTRCLQPVDRGWSSPQRIRNFWSLVDMPRLFLALKGHYENQAWESLKIMMSQL